MGTIVSLHIFLEEHFHPALHKAPGDMCSFLTAGWVFMLTFLATSAGCTPFFLVRGDGFYHRSDGWPPHVTARVRATYLYITAALLVAAVSMATVCQLPSALAFLGRYTFGSVVWSFLALVMTGDLARAIPFEGMNMAKHAAFVLHAAVMGLVLAPLCLLGGPVLLKAGWATTGVTALMIILASIAPASWVMGISVPISFLYILVFLCGVTGIFSSTSTTLGAYAYAVNLYLGCVAMTGFLLFYTFFFMLIAERMPDQENAVFDPISAAILVFRHTLDIFMRFAILMVGGGDGYFKQVCHHYPTRTE